MEAKRKHIIYKEEFRRQAVEMVIHSGKTQAQVARELGCSEYSLSLWKKAYLRQQAPAELIISQPAQDRHDTFARGWRSLCCGPSSNWARRRSDARTLHIRSAARRRRMRQQLCPRSQTERQTSAIPRHCQSLMVRLGAWLRLSVQKNDCDSCDNA